jgi:rhodanese-related sulfurtransferase
MKNNLLLCLKAGLRAFAALVCLTWLFFSPMQAQAQVSLMFGDLTWARVNTYLDKNYADVKSLTTAEAALMPKATFLDVRGAQEFKVSHIPNAKFYDHSAEFVKGLPKDTLIVVYCSVGIRSAKVAQQLQNQGFVNAKNLKGSLFMWANENRPMQGDLPNKVHPYNERWGLLLDKPLHAPINL